MTNPSLHKITAAQAEWLENPPNTSEKVYGFLVNGYPGVLLWTDAVTGDPQFVATVRGLAVSGGVLSFSEARQLAHNAYRRCYLAYKDGKAKTLTVEEEKALGIDGGRRSADHPYSSFSIDTLTAEDERELALQLVSHSNHNTHQSRPQ